MSILISIWKFLARESVKTQTKKDPKEERSRRPFVCCSGGRWISPPPGAALSCLNLAFSGTNRKFSTSFVSHGFRSEFRVSNGWFMLALVQMEKGRRLVGFGAVAMGRSRHRFFPCVSLLKLGRVWIAWRGAIGVLSLFLEFNSCEGDRRCLGANAPYAPLLVDCHRFVRVCPEFGVVFIQLPAV
ncbi:hypothetical protein Bca4012_028072 [Brassica carinata]